jgi:hypothetical protein
MSVCMVSYMTIDYGHDDRLWACQSCLLKLMYVFRLLYVIKCFRVMICFGFQFVNGCIKNQALPFFC